MRQTGRRTVRRGGREALCGKLRQTTYGIPPCPCLVSKGPLLQYSGLWPVCQIQTNKNSAADEALLFYMYLQPMDRFTCVFKYEPVLIHQYSTCLFVQGCVHAWCARVVKLWVKIWVCVCVSVMNTHCTTWNIKRWRWRCPCAGIGWGCVMILSRAMSCGNGCLAHPLITSMFNPPPATITLVFPLSKWPSCLRRFPLSDCGRGVFSRLYNKDQTALSCCRSPILISEDFIAEWTLMSSCQL